MTKEEREIKIVNACREGMTVRAATKHFGASTSTITSILRRNNIVSRIGRPPTCEVDHTAFDTLTPTSMYWMGFLFADGSVVNGGGSPQLIVDLGAKDRRHLERFARDFLKSEHAIRDVTHKASTYGDIIVSERQSVAFRVRSKQLVAALAAHGLIAGKKRRVPSASLEASPDFWRGCVDGDGTVGIYPDKNKYLYPVLKLCGQMAIMLSFQKFLSQHAIKVNITKTSSGIFQVQTMGAVAKQISAMLYHERLTVALERKLLIAHEISK